MLLSVKMNGQDTCNQTTYTPIYILNNPSLLPNNPSQPANTPCTSGFRGVPFWYPASTEMLIGFLNPCTDYTIPDTAYISGSIQTPEACLFPTVPQPVPDGKGVIAFSDFGFVDGAVYQNPDYKSFASTCLTIPLKKDSLYRLDFFAGFGTPGSEYLNVNGQLLGPSASPSPETFGLFGEPDCSAVGNPIPLYSCIQRAGWISLGSVEVKSGPGTWQKVSILFTPPMDMQAIAVGPGCDTNFTSFPISGTYNGESYRTNTYSYFIDSLQFYEAGAPPPQVSLVSGDSCTPTIVLEMQPAAFYATSVLQWYRNDTLVSGQQASTLTIPRMNAGTALYSCQVKNDSVCLVSNPFPVNWTPLPNASVLGSPDTTVCTDSVLLNAFTDSAFHYVWQDGSTQPYFFATQNGTYTVSISDGCGTTRAQKTVYFATCDFNAHVPNAFTPNGDGRNDVFRALFFFPPILFNIRIFNRNGLEVFSSTDPSRGWDGNFNNTKQPAGAYIWTIRFSDLTGKPHSLIGTLVLIR